MKIEETLLTLPHYMAREFTEDTVIMHPQEMTDPIRADALPVYVFRRAQIAPHLVDALIRVWLAPSKLHADTIIKETLKTASELRS